MCYQNSKWGQKKELIQKYKIFKDTFNVAEEVKGSDLMTRTHNNELQYFVDNILDDKHFEICIYDKKFFEYPQTTG